MNYKNIRYVVFDTTTVATLTFICSGAKAEGLAKETTWVRSAR
jgi:hypothetical protein